MPDIAVVAPPDGQHSTPLLEWAQDNRDFLAQQLLDTGVLLLRGFATNAPDTSRQLLSEIGAEAMDNVFWSTPRSQVADHTFTATEYPAHKEISLHSEMSYYRRFPRLLCFHALECPQSGGGTTLAPLDPVSRTLGSLTTELHERGVAYTRIFHPGLDIPLSTAFGTEDLSRIEEIVASHGMTMSTASSGSPRIAHTAQGALTDEMTSDPIWFNQILQFHEAALPPTVRANLANICGPELPRQVAFGDGHPIPDETIAQVVNAFSEHRTVLTWQPADVAIIDNLRWAHGRQAFHGGRVLHVAMGSPCDGNTRPPLLPPPRTSHTPTKKHADIRPGAPGYRTDQS